MSLQLSARLHVCPRTMSSSSQSRQDDASTVVPWCCLPKLALQIVFKHVPQGLKVGRPSSCALVCTSWAKAAAAATASIDLDTCANPDSLQLWLHNHGDNLTKLHVTTTHVELTSLPCPKLQDLLLCVKGPARDCYAGNHLPTSLPCNIVQQLTQLTRLEPQALALDITAPHSTTCRPCCVCAWQRAR